MRFFSLDEQETVINIMRTDDYADIYSCDATIMCKLDKRVEQSDEWTVIEETKNEQGRVIARRYRCPKKLVSFRSKTITRELTEEQKRAAAERLRMAREKKGING